MQAETMERLREEIDRVDGELTAAFERRMRLADRVAEAKRGENLPITDAAREERVVEGAVARLAEDTYAGEMRAVMRLAISLSKARQRRLLMGGESLMPHWQAYTPPRSVVYQGVPGAFGEEAAHALYPDVQANCAPTFQAVFDAVHAGQAQAGVVPIENSQTGAIGDVYDLLRSHGCYIVAETRVPVVHNLLGLPGAQVGQIREVLSHPEGFLQCAEVLSGHGFIHSPMPNTAMAAREVARRGDAGVAAIASARAARLYGLSVLLPGIQHSRDNATRFIAIAATPQLPGGADRLSITFHTQHRCGALAEVLMSFAIEGINLTRIESRRASGGEYRFFVDLDGDVRGGHMESALCRAAMGCTYIEVLGGYVAAK